MEYTNLIEIRQIYKGESRRFFTYGPYSQPIWDVLCGHSPRSSTVQHCKLGMTGIEHPIARVPQAGNNEFVLVQNWIDRPHKNGNVWVFGI